MSVPGGGRLAQLLALLCISQTIIAQEYQIPDVTIQALKPRGIRVSLPEDPQLPRINLFVFQGNVNKAINNNDVGLITAELMRPKNGRWVYQDDEVQLRVGDVINYYIHVVMNRRGYTKDNLTYRVQELIDSNAPSPSTATPPRVPPTSCLPTLTEIREGSVCAGQTIFEDQFDSLREDIWSIEQYLPTGPEHPFVSYQRPPNAPTVTVEGGILRIMPKLQQNLAGFDDESIIMNDNHLDLTKGCTRPGYCDFVNRGSQIMPPIASGRITSAFAFKYGLIEVRAKVPQGDWLYPDILLESVFKKYGSDNYASGILRIAGALGNIELTKDATDYGNKILYGGPIMNFKCLTNLLAKKASATAWGNDFHTYALRWTPDRITLMVDGEEWGRIEPMGSSLHKRLPEDTCDPPRVFLKTPMAPFDDFFRITLGVSAGGITEFPDLVANANGARKPWRNSAMKARVTFLNALGSWLPSWTQPALLVDYVKVRAL